MLINVFATCSKYQKAQKAYTPRRSGKMEMACQHMYKLSRNERKTGHKGRYTATI